MIRSAIASASRRLVALAAFAAIVAGACGNPPSPSPSPVASPTPSAAPSSAAPTTSAAVACASADLSVTGGPWGGAAGSRGSDIVVENVGAAACLLPAAATVAIVDQAGTVLLSNAPAQAGSGPELAPAATTGFSLVLGNWCDQAVALPLSFRLALAGDAVPISDLSVATTDDLPPCNGPDQPATLSTTDWLSG
jgi:hypothetical protein